MTFGLLAGIGIFVVLVLIGIFGNRGGGSCS